MVADQQPARTDEIAAFSLSEVEHHMRCFIDSFVDPNAKDRWREFLVDKYPRWAPETHDKIPVKLQGKAFELLKSCKLDLRYCTEMPPRLRTFTWQQTVFGGLPGLFFDLETPCSKISVADAESRFQMRDDSAILSVVPGKQALLYAHGAGVWLCEKR